MVDLPPSQGDNYSAQQGCFEGPEKLLEVWFSPSAQHLADHQHLGYFNVPSNQNNNANYDDDDDKSDDIVRFSPPRANSDNTGLRVVPRPVWDDLLALVKCTVLNVISNKDVDAYLLSESSMFVYPHKLILKTCGTTTLLLALPRILEVAQQYCGFEKVWRVFYSRKAFMFPERQMGPHRSWDNEVEFLNKHFDNGAAYTIGKVASDHWYLYLTKPSDDVLHHGPDALHDGVSHDIGCEILTSGTCTPVSENPSPFGNNAGFSYPDQTVEILMTHLNPKVMAQGFYHDASKTEAGTVGGRWVDQVTGIKDLYPKAQIDSFLFEPCGYSSNGLQGDRYFTIHVTPEPACSYASFETNIPVEETHAGGKRSPIETLVSQVINIFDPASFSVTFFSAHHKEHSRSHMVHAMGSMPVGYRRTDRILYEFDGYDLVYGHYTKLQ
ncbi:adenosylmethionine decarboxylase [Dichotomocladium elegans]|nr:adenosylmethionine decarboxylase [Dichotomocladium elegans]